jgi:DNA polymerase III subunit delta'
VISSKTIGHEDIRKHFISAIEAGTLSHAHLIIGDDGIGKSLLAKETAVRILGRQEIKQYVDILEYRSKKKSIGVDEIRGIIEETVKKPYEGDRKVIIIYDGEKITVQAQNAFLKTIEEPPRGVYIFILCKNSELILDTIKSRCQIHKLSRLSGKEMSEFLARKYPSLAESQYRTILAFSDGIPGRAERFIEDTEFKELRSTCIKLLKDVNHMREAQILGYESFFSKHKEQWEEILSMLLLFVRDIMLYKDAGTEELIINKDKLDEIKEVSGMFSFSKLNAIIDVINYTRSNLNSNVSAGLTYDIMLLKMLEA